MASGNPPSAGWSFSIKASPPRLRHVQFFLGVWESKEAKASGHPSRQGTQAVPSCYIEKKQVAAHPSEIARVFNTVAFGEGTSDRGKRSLTDLGRCKSDPDKRFLATVGEDSGSDRDKRSLEASAPPRVRESETACADSRSFPLRPTSHSGKSIVRSTLCPLVSDC